MQFLKVLIENFDYQANGLLDENASLGESGRVENIKKSGDEEDYSNRVEFQKLNQSDNHIEEQVEDDEYDENPFQKELEEMRQKKKQMEENRRLLK